MTGFFLVTYPSEVRFRESQEFITVLREKQIPLSGIFLNRVEKAAPRTLPSELQINREDRSAIESVLNYRADLVTQQQFWISKFESTFNRLPQIQIEKRSEDIHDLETLSQIGKRLIS